MGRVAVLFPPLAVSRDFIDYPYFADLGAVQAAAVLSEAGHEVELFDALAHPGAEARVRSDGRLELGCPPRLDALREPDVCVVAFTPFHRPPRRDALLGELLKTLRARWPERPLVLADSYQSGQHYVEADPAELLVEYPEVDVLLRYEAEHSLPRLASELTTGRPRERRVLRGVEPEDLDALPLPAWDRVDLEAYFRFHQRVMRELGRPRWAFPIDGRSLPMLTSRGCPFQCVHCSSNPGRELGAPKTQRKKSRARMERELAWLASLGARRVHVLDELANVNQRHFDDLLDLLEARGLRLEIPNGLRADYLGDTQLDRLARLCSTLSVSAESGVQRVVSEVVKKDLDLGAIERVARGARKRRLPLLVHFMIGLPGETRAEMTQTLELAARLSERFGAEASLQYATPLPGTALARSLVHLPVVEDWGPHFQQRPSPTSTEASPEDLVRFKRAFADRLALGRRPRRVLLQTTFECNNRCAFCTTGTREQRPGDLARHLALLAEARQNGARELWLDGGEPTLFPALFTLIREARALGFETVGLVTNGRRAAYPEYAARLARSGLSHLAFTLQGASAARHAREVGVAEAFEQTIAAVRNVRRAAEPRLRLSVKTTMTRTNLDELSAIASLVHELGVPRLDLEMTLPCGARTGELAPDPSLAADAAGRVIAAWRDRLEVNVSNLPWCFLPGFEDHLLPDELMSPSPVTLLGNDAPVLDYWRSHREHRAQCTTCVRRVCCGGFFLESGVEEPDWLGGARVSS